MKMNRLRILVTVFLFLIEGSVCFKYNYLPDMYRFPGCKDICADLELEKFLTKVSGLPTTELELNTHCPAATKYVSCVIDECIKSNVSGILLDSDTIRFADTQKVLVTETCTPGTEMRKSYLSVVDCVKEKIILDYQTSYGCSKESRSKFENYTQSPENKSGKNFKNRYETVCLTEGYYYYCIGEITLDRCGSFARDVAMDILKKTIMISRCGGINFTDSQTDFLNFLNLEKEQLRRYASFVDAFGIENHSSSKTISFYTLIYLLIIMKFVSNL